MAVSEARRGAPSKDRTRTRDDLVVRTLVAHADAVLRTARRHSLCAEDASDAYQRAVEIFLRHAERIDPERADRWLHVVVRREAIALRAQRSRALGAGEVDLDAVPARDGAGPDERVIAFESVARTAEAMRHLKPAEAQALGLHAAGRSYAQIANELGWTRTKVNRCLAEGRARLRARLAGMESGEECERWTTVLEAMHAGSAAAEDLAAVRPHLRNCPGCRARVRALHEERAALGVLLPAGALAPLAPGVVDGGPGVAAGAESSGSLLGRLWDALGAGMHDRVASSAMKLQALADVAGGGKAAAVAASAAALAGGGVAVDRVTDDAARPAALARTAQAPVAASGAAGTPAPAPAPVPSPAPAPVAAAPTGSREPSPAPVAAPAIPGVVDGSAGDDPGGVVATADGAGEGAPGVVLDPVPGASATAAPSGTSGPSPGRGPGAVDVTALP